MERHMVLTLVEREGNPDKRRVAAQRWVQNITRKASKTGVE